MEKLKKKHDHKLTHLLKAFIFSIVMLAPFIAIGSKMLYLWNPNAKDSYSDNVVYKITNINANNYDNQTIFNLKYKEPSTINTSVVEFRYISITASELDISQAVYDTLTTWTLRNNNEIMFGNGTTYNLVTKKLTLDIFKNFNFMGNKVTNMFEVFDVTLISLTNETIDNAFYYAVNQLDTEPLFNWTKDTAIYTIIDEMTTGLEIGTNTLSILLTYWALNTAIYIVFDIIIEMFVKITHIIS